MRAESSLAVSAPDLEKSRSKTAAPHHVATRRHRRLSAKDEGRLRIEEVAGVQSRAPAGVTSASARSSLNSGLSSH